MRTPLSIRSALLVAGLTALGACGDATGSSRGTVTLLLKDAPGDVKKAVVTIDQIYLQPGVGFRRDASGAPVHSRDWRPPHAAE